MFERDRGAEFKLVTGLTSLTIVLLSAVFLFDLGWKNGKSVGEYEANSNAYARHTQEQIKDCLALSGDAPQAICIVEVVNSQNEQQRAEADLVAQTEMGLWAFGMLVVSSFMLVVSALGVWWIRDTLKETRRAVKSAEDAVDVTRTIGQAQVRAYLSFEDARYFTGPDTPIGVDFVVRNSGQSPAKNVHVIVQYFCFLDERIKRPEGYKGADASLPNKSSGPFYTHPMVLGDIPAGGITAKEPVSFGNPPVPDNPRIDARGCAHIHSVTIGVFASDVFDHEIFVAGKAPVALEHGGDGAREQRKFGGFNCRGRDVNDLIGMGWPSGFVERPKRRHDH